MTMVVSSPARLRFVPDRLQKFDAGLEIGLALLQPIAHGTQPAQVRQALVHAGEIGHRRRLVGDGAAQGRAHRIGQGSSTWPRMRQPGQQPTTEAAQSGARLRPPSSGNRAAWRDSHHLHASCAPGGSSTDPPLRPSPPWWPRHRGGAGIPPGPLSGSCRRWSRGAAHRSAPSRQTWHRGAHRGRPGSRPRHRPATLHTRPSAAALTSALRSMPMGQITTVNGASASGQIMPRSSWFCSTAAAGKRVMPMP